MSKVALLQLPTLSLSEARLDYYLKTCKNSGANLVMLGEYVLNSFFKELEVMPKSMIKKQSDEKKNSLLNLAKKYDLTIISPLILVRGNEILKVVAKISSSGGKFYEQQILMPYSHWNEKKFFANNQDELNFLTFKHEGLKFGVMFGFETHFDASFAFMQKKGIDALLVPSACTFNSKERWAELLKMRAFINNIYILRANRIGGYKRKNSDEVWEFYGDSMIITPFGEISQRLNDSEEMMIADISKKEILSARKILNFSEIAKKL